MKDRTNDTKKVKGIQRRVLSGNSTLDKNPKFNLEHMDSRVSIFNCDKDDRIQFIETLNALSQMTWREIVNDTKHARGYEVIKPKDKKWKLKMKRPECFINEKLLVFRYSGKKPMIAVKNQEILQILWVAKKYGDLYEH